MDDHAYFNDLRDFKPLRPYQHDGVTQKFGCTVSPLNVNMHGMMVIYVKEKTIPCNFQNSWHDGLSDCATKQSYDDSLYVLKVPALSAYPLFNNLKMFKGLQAKNHMKFRSPIPD